MSNITAKIQYPITNTEYPMFNITAQFQYPINIRYREAESRRAGEYPTDEGKTEFIKIKENIKQRIRNNQ